MNKIKLKSSRFSYFSYLRVLAINHKYICIYVFYVCMHAYARARAHTHTHTHTHLLRRDLFIYFDWPNITEIIQLFANSFYKHAYKRYCQKKV